MLNLDTPWSCQRFFHPFEFGFVEDPFTELESALRLADEFPARGFEYRRHGSGRFVRRPLIVKGDHALFEPESLAASPLALGEQLLSERYRERIGEAMDVELAGAVLEAWFWRYDSGTEFVPHLDEETKIVTQVFYLNREWPASAGGQLRILNSEDPEDAAFEITPHVRLSSLIRRSDESWHVLLPISPHAPASRNTVTVHFHRPDR